MKDLTSANSTVSKMTNIAILGFGVVGSGVYEIVNSNNTLEEKCGSRINVKHVLDVRELSPHPAQSILTRNFSDILNDSEVSIAIECIGGLSPAYEYTKALLASGKSVVTSNKAVVAAHGRELQEIASQNNSTYMYEASVGGGIPIIRPLKQCLVANKITEIFGIFNGTTNYILTQMKIHGTSFADALAQAQAKGYAESDPSADVEGHDTARKIAILSEIAFGQSVNFTDIPTQGITQVSLDDFHKAEEAGCTLKLIGSAKLVNGKPECKVAPTHVPKDSLLANVNDVFNGIVVRGDSVGEVMFYGHGAGKMPTASAVMADVLDIIKQQ